jgi:hypothetical protein
MRWVSAFAVAATLVATFFLPVPASRAQNGNAPWCAVVNMGFENVTRICAFQSVEECVPFVLAGNRGSCEPNFEYSPSKHAVKRHSRHRVKGY